MEKNHGQEKFLSKFLLLVTQRMVSGVLFQAMEGKIKQQGRMDRHAFGFQMDVPLVAPNVMELQEGLVFTQTKQIFVDKAIKLQFVTLL